MKKTNKLALLVALGLMSVTAQAQVKVGANPTTVENGVLLQLDQNGNRGGLLMSRVALTSTTDATTIAMSTATAGSLIYNTATAGSGATAVTPGFYMWSGTAWNRIATFGSGTENIYTTNGSLAANRTVDMPNRSLAFTPSGTQLVNQFSVDGTTFSVDALNNRVGIGTAAPNDFLEVRTNVTTGVGLRLSSSGTSNFGTIGITAGSQSTLDRYITYTNSFSGAANSRAHVFMAGTDELLTIRQNGSVGIGTAAPDARLSVAGTGYDLLNITRGNTGTGSATALIIRKTLNANPEENTALTNGAVIGQFNFQANHGAGYGAGNATITAFAVGNQTTANRGGRLEFQTVANGSTTINTRMTIADNGNVGIGINTPTETLDVDGTARLRGIPNVSSAEIVSTLVINADGVVKKDPSGQFGTTLTVAGGATSSAISLPNTWGGAYEVSISLTNACGRGSLAKFLVYGTNTNNTWSLSHLGSITSVSGTLSSYTVTQTVNNSIAVSVSNTSCSGSPNNQFNYTFQINTSNGQISIINNTTVSMSYRVKVDIL